MPASELLPWSRRPAEVRSLLNPAFCSLLLRRAAQGYSSKGNGGLPIALAFLILPVVLHKRTREAMPGTARSRMHVWMRENPSIRLGFADRATALVPFAREALLFGLTHSSLRLASGGALEAGRVGDAFRSPAGREVRACMDAAFLFGKLLAAAGDAGTILSAWGVRP